MEERERERERERKRDRHAVPVGVREYTEEDEAERVSWTNGLRDPMTGKKNSAE